MERKNVSLTDRLRGTNPTNQPKQNVTLQDYLHIRKPLNVNKELLEDNPDIDTVLSNTDSFLKDEKDRERSETRFQVPAYEKQIKDKRYKSTEVNSVQNKFLGN